MSYDLMDHTIVAKRKNNMILFCVILFMGTLVVADVTSVKLFSTSVFGYATQIFGQPFLLPAGTLAFAVTFLCTDVICEIEQSRVTAIKLILIATFVRIITILYFLYCVGDASGAAWPLDVPPFWSADQQEHYRFVF